MAYGHAERNLAAVRRLEAETQELLSNLPVVPALGSRADCDRPQRRAHNTPTRQRLAERATSMIMAYDTAP
jgi:hypothetical protein